MDEPNTVNSLKQALNEVLRRYGSPEQPASCEVRGHNGALIVRLPAWLRSWPLPERFRQWHGKPVSCTYDD